MNSPAALHAKVADHLERGEPAQAFFYALQVKDEGGVGSRLSLASLYLFLGLYRKAKQTLTPTNDIPAAQQVDVFAKQAEICAAQQDFRGAGGWRRKVLDLLREAGAMDDLTEAHAIIAWGDSLAATGLLYDAIAAYRESMAVRVERGNVAPLALCKIGGCYRNLGCFDLAEEAFDASLDIEDDPTTRVFLRDVHAARRLEIAAEEVEDRAEYWALRYELCELAQSLVRTRFQYEAAPENIETAAAYAGQLIELHRPDEASRVLQTLRLSKADEDDPRFHTALARLSVAQGELVAASNHYKAAADASGQQPGIECERGRVFQWLEQHEAAYECYKRAVDANAGKRVTAAAYTAMGHLNRLQQRYKSAARCYASAMEFQPSSDELATLHTDARAAARLAKKNG